MTVSSPALKDNNRLSRDSQNEGVARDASKHPSEKVLRTWTVKNIGLVLVEIALLGGLALLYTKAEEIDLREPNRIAGVLRQLKELDARWDIAMLRASLDEDLAALPPLDLSPEMERALGKLTEAANRTGSAALNNGLSELMQELRNKSRLVEKFQAEHVGAKRALASMRAQLRDLIVQAAQLKVDLRRISPSIDQLEFDAPLYFMLGLEEHYDSVYAALTEIDVGASRFPQVLFDQATQATDFGRALLDHKSTQMRLVEQIELLTAGPRLERMAIAYGEEIEASVRDKEIYRTYLISYAAVLLAIVIWFGIRIRAARLKLEQRVKERTSELSEAMRQLKSSEAQLIQSEKLSSLGQMVAGVAHEINTPLAYVKNSLGSVSEKLGDIGGTIDETERLLGLLQSGGSADPDALSGQFNKVSQRVLRIKKHKVVEELDGLVKDGLHGATQMSEIVSNLKDFSRLDRSKATQFNLNDGLNSTLAMAKHQLKSVTIEKHYGDIPSVFCSPSQINQVFLNLITNAAQALDRGKGKIVLRSRLLDDGVAVDVEDNGAGIAPDVLPKIFDPFFSTKDIGKGTGLGLSISYKIIKQHHGRIDVDTKPGRGTRFTVYLPLKPPVSSGAVSQG